MIRKLAWRFQAFPTALDNVAKDPRTLDSVVKDPTTLAQTKPSITFSGCLGLCSCVGGDGFAVPII